MRAIANHNNLPPGGDLNQGLDQVVRELNADALFDGFPQPRRQLAVIPLGIVFHARAG